MVGFLSRINEKYYSLMEWLEDHGIPVVKYFVEPLESRGIPSLPVLLAIVLIPIILMLLMSGNAEITKDIYVYADGKPVKGAKVIVRTPTGETLEFYTDENGRAVINAPEGSEVIGAVYGDYEAKGGLLSSINEILLYPKKKKIEIEVYDEYGGEINATIDVFVLGKLVSERTGSKVSFTFGGKDGIAAREKDPVKIRVTAEGYEPFEEVHSLGNWKPKVIVNMRRKKEKVGIIKVYVKGESGFKGIAELKPPGGKVFQKAPVTDGLGVFEGVAYGKYLVTLKGLDGRVFDTKSVTLKSKEAEITFEIKEKKFVKVKVKVTDEENNPVEGALLKFGDFETETDSSGEGTIIMKRGERGELIVFKDGYEIERVEINSDMKEVFVKLREITDESMGKIIVFVKNESGKPIPNATVFLKDEFGNELGSSSNTNEFGRVELNVPEGKYIVVVQHENTVREEGVSVNAGEVSYVTIVLIDNPALVEIQTDENCDKVAVYINDKKFSEGFVGEKISIPPGKKVRFEIQCGDKKYITREYEFVNNEDREIRIDIPDEFPLVKIKGVYSDGEEVEGLLLGGKYELLFVIGTDEGKYTLSVNKGSEIISKDGYEKEIPKNVYYEDTFKFEVVGEGILQIEVSSAGLSDYFGAYVGNKSYICKGDFCFAIQTEDDTYEKGDEVKINASILYKGDKPKQDVDFNIDAESPDGEKQNLLHKKINLRPWDEGDGFAKFTPDKSGTWTIKVTVGEEGVEKKITVRSETQRDKLKMDVQPRTLVRGTENEVMVYLTDEEDRVPGGATVKVYEIIDGEKYLITEKDVKKKPESVRFTLSLAVEKILFVGEAPGYEKVSLSFEVPEGTGSTGEEAEGTGEEGSADAGTEETGSGANEAGSGEDHLPCPGDTTTPSESAGGGAGEAGGPGSTPGAAGGAIRDEITFEHDGSETDEITITEGDQEEITVNYNGDGCIDVEVSFNSEFLEVKKDETPLENGDTIEICSNEGAEIQIKAKDGSGSVSGTDTTVCFETKESKKCITIHINPKQICTIKINSTNATASEVDGKVKVNITAYVEFEGACENPSVSATWGNKTVQLSGERHYNGTIYLTGCDILVNEDTDKISIKASASGAEETTQTNIEKMDEVQRSMFGSLDGVSSACYTDYKKYDQRFPPFWKEAYETFYKVETDNAKYKKEWFRGNAGEKCKNKFCDLTAVKWVLGKSVLAKNLNVGDEFLLVSNKLENANEVVQTYNIGVRGLAFLGYTCERKGDNFECKNSSKTYNCQYVVVDNSKAYVLCWRIDGGISFQDVGADETVGTEYTCDFIDTAKVSNYSDCYDEYCKDESGWGASECAACCMKKFPIPSIAGSKTTVKDPQKRYYKVTVENVVSKDVCGDKCSKVERDGGLYRACMDACKPTQYIPPFVFVKLKEITFFGRSGLSSKNLGKIFAERIGDLLVAMNKKKTAVETYNGNQVMLLDLRNKASVTDIVAIKKAVCSAPEEEYSELDGYDGTPYYVRSDGKSIWCCGGIEFKPAKICPSIREGFLTNVQYINDAIYARLSENLFSGKKKINNTPNAGSISSKVEAQREKADVDLSVDLSVNREHRPYEPIEVSVEVCSRVPTENAGRYWYLLVVSILDNDGRIQGDAFSTLEIREGGECSTYNVVFPGQKTGEYTVKADVVLLDTDKFEDVDTGNNVKQARISVFPKVECRSCQECENGIRAKLRYLDKDAYMKVVLLGDIVGDKKCIDVENIGIKRIIFDLNDYTIKCESPPDDKGICIKLTGGSQRPEIVMKNGRIEGDIFAENTNITMNGIDMYEEGSGFWYFVIAKSSTVNYNSFDKIKPILVD